MKNNMTIKQKIMVTAVGAAGLAFVAHSVGLLTGWYDLAPIYEALNINAAEFGWTTVSAPGAYLLARVGLDWSKSRTQYQQELDKFNTDRVVDSQLLVKAETAATNLKLDRNYQAQQQIIEQNKLILEAEALKASRYAELSEKLNSTDSEEV